MFMQCICWEDEFQNKSSLKVTTRRTVTGDSIWMLEAMTECKIIYNWNAWSFYMDVHLFINCAYERKCYILWTPISRLEAKMKNMHVNIHLNRRKMLSAHSQIFDCMVLWYLSTLTEIEIARFSIALRSPS